MIDDASEWPALAGSSRAIQMVRMAIDGLAAGGASLLLHGEPGSGKLQCATALHRHCPDGATPFSILPLGGLSEQEAEQRILASIGARGPAPTVSGGTLYLEAVETLPLSLQCRLAGILSGFIEHHVRIIASSVAPLEEQVRRGRFSSGLYRRLALVQITLPALRDRTEDIPAIVDLCLKRWTEHRGTPPPIFSATALKILADYDWPGNLPELERTVEAACATTVDSLIDAERVRGLLRRLPRAHAAPHLVPLWQAERDYILVALERSRWNKTVAARCLEIGRNTLIRKLRSFGILGRRPV